MSLIPSELATNNLAANVLFVAENGNDSTARVGSIDRPWATVEVAVNAASAGQKVVVLPGSYTVNANIAKDDVHVITVGAVTMSRSAAWGIGNIVVYAGGSGYQSTDTVTFTGAGTTAVATPVVVGGAIVGLNVTNFGDYSSGNAPKITVSGGTGAVIACTVSNALFHLTGPQYIDVTYTPVSGAYQVGETVTATSGQTGRLVSAGGGLMVLVNPTGNWNTASGTLTGGTSGATGTHVSATSGFTGFTADYDAGGDGLEVVADYGSAIITAYCADVDIRWRTMYSANAFSAGTALVQLGSGNSNLTFVTRGDISCSNVGATGSSYAVLSPRVKVTHYGNISLTGATDVSAAALYVSQNYADFTIFGNIIGRMSVGRCVHLDNYRSITINGDVFYQYPSGTGYTIYADGPMGSFTMNGSVNEQGSSGGQVYIAPTQQGIEGWSSFVFNGNIGVHLLLDGPCNVTVTGSMLGRNVHTTHAAATVSINGNGDDNGYCTIINEQGRVYLNGSFVPAYQGQHVDVNYCYGGYTQVRGNMVMGTDNSSLQGVFNMLSTSWGLGYIRLTSGGYYPSGVAPTVTFGSGAAAATAILGPGKTVIAVHITTRGAYSGGAPSVTFSAGVGDTAATGVAVVGGVLEVSGRIENTAATNHSHGIYQVSGELILSGGVVKCADANSRPVCNRAQFPALSKFYGYFGAINQANAALAQQYTFTVTGPTTSPGDPYTITVGGVPYTYNKLVGDNTPSLVAAAIAAALAGNPLATISGSGASRTLTAVTPGTWLTVTANAPGPGPVFDLSLTESRSNSEVLTNEIATGSIIYDTAVI